MPSEIDETKPIQGNPTTQSVRENFARAKAEISRLQAGGGASRIGSFPGAAVSQVGTARYYPPMACTISNLTAWAGNAVAGDTTLTLRKNGTAIGTAVIPAGTSVAPSTALNVALAVTDYLTIDLSNNGGIDVCARIDF